MDFGGEVGQERAAIEEEELSLSGAHDDAVRGRADWSEIGVLELLGYLVLQTAQIPHSNTGGSVYGDDLVAVEEVQPEYLRAIGDLNWCNVLDH